jgi:hypothetical protein
MFGYRWFVLLLSMTAVLVTPIPSGAALADEGTTPAPSRPDLQIPYSRRASVDDGALQLTFATIDEDSRCPREVMCVWQGRALIRVQAVLDGVDQGDLALTTTVVPRNGPSSADVTVGPYTLRLVGMTPYPSVNQKPGKDEYIAIIRVTRS